MESLLNHLWQSTAFACAATAISCALRTNHARTRYWLWLAASTKFLVPFSMFVTLGHRLESPTMQPILEAEAVKSISTTFSPALLAVTTTPGPSEWPVWVIVWSLGAAFVTARWLLRWCRLSRIRRAARPMPLDIAVPALLTTGPAKPGIFGVFRPVLLWPEGLSGTLTPAQWKAILSHELYLANPLRCGAGVSGSDLRKRISAIMTHARPASLNRTRKTLIAVAAVGAIAAPLLIGAMQQQTAANSYQFEVASIRPAAPGHQGTSIHTGQTEFRTRNCSLFSLITFAYNIQPYQVSGGPDWVRQDRYDIRAKHDEVEGNVKVSDLRGLGSRDARIGARVRHLLAERFQLKLREEAKELPVYALVLDRGGHKLKAAPNGSGNMNTNQNNGSGVLTGDGVTLKRLAFVLSSVLGRPVTNETGSEELYALDLRWSSDSAIDGGPTIFTALREQLGLKLESTKGQVTTYVIEHVEKPSEN